MNNRTAFLTGLNIAGVFSAITLFLNNPQALPLKIARISFMTSGAIAGAILLKEYRTPTKLEREAKQIDQQKSELERERERLHQEVSELRARDQLVLQETEARLQQWLDEQNKSFQEQYDQQRVSYEQVIAQLQNQIAIANLPKMPTGTRRVDYLSRCVMEVMIEYGVICEFEDAHLTPHSFLLWLSPARGVTVSQCKKALENLPARLRGLYGAAEVVASDGYLEITIPLQAEEEKAIARAQRDDKGIKPEPLNWFDRVIIETHHYFVSGKTGSGKSVLVNNIACRALTVLMENDNGKPPEIIIIDPKFGQSSAWEFHGKKIIPQYQNYRPDVVHRTFLGNCPEGILEMGKITRQRLDEGAAAARDGIILEKPQSIMFIADEAADLFSQPAAFWEQIYAEAELDMPCECTTGKDLINMMIASLKTTLRLGRSEKVKSMIIGQSDLVSTYELNKPDLLNCTMFYLGQNVARGIDFVATDRQNKKELKEQLSLYQERAETDPRYRYYCLVSTHFCKPFLALMPPENFYSQGSLLGSSYVQSHVQNQNLNVHRQPEPLSSRSEPAKSSDFNDSPDLSDLGFNAGDAKMLEYCILQGKNQDESIFQVFSVKKGGSKKYQNGRVAFKRIKDWLKNPQSPKPNDLESLVLQNFHDDND